MKPGEQSKPNPFGSDMPTLARFLSRFGADMPVIDKTGLTGQFKLDLDMTKITEAAADISGTPPTNEGMYRGLVEFIDRQWGLKLIPTKALIEVLVIDRVNRPVAPARAAESPATVFRVTIKNVYVNFAIGKDCGVND